jgi:hypothetical protein
MRRPKIQPIRNKLDLTDRVQVRVVTKRLGVSQSELTDLVGRIGNSMAALAKEVHLQKARKLPASVQVPPAEVFIASVAVAEAAATELGAPAEPRG